MRSRICHLLLLLKIHRPDCEHCAAHPTCGADLRKRLAELNERGERTSDSGDAGRAPVLRKAA